jgi:hypothetical protein
MSYEDAVREFLSEQEYKQNSPATIMFYTERLAMFRAAPGAEVVADLNPAAMKAWLVTLRQRGLSANSLVNYDPWRGGVEASASVRQRGLRIPRPCVMAFQRLALPAGGWDEATPLCRNQL